MSKEIKKVGLIGLVALTVSSVIGGGIFNLMSDVAKSASVGPAVTALILSGLGMGIFVLCLQNLNNRLSHLNAGIYSYAEEGFGGFVGFNSALGYWLSIFLGNVALGSLAFSALGYFLPIFGDGSNLYSVIFASIILWGMHFIILRGASFASMVNVIITIAKLLPLGAFILALVFAFNPTIFTADLWGNATNTFVASDFGSQVSAAMVSVVWVFVGVEGAIVYSARATSKQIVGKANILSFVIITLVYLLVIVLSYAVLSRGQLAELDKPAMAQVLESVVGKWGAIVINAGVVVSAIGAWFACTMFSGEILYQAAKEQVFPKLFLKENKHHAPSNALLISNGLVQFFFLSLLVNKSAYNFMALLASSTMLVPYFFVSLSQAKLSFGWEKRISKQVILGVIATIYMGYCMLSSGWQYILVTSLLFAPGMGLYILARKQENKKIFTVAEWIGAIFLISMALLSIYLMLNGTIDVANM